jgi:hypothetical protein
MISKIYKIIVSALQKSEYSAPGSLVATLRINGQYGKIHRNEQLGQEHFFVATLRFLKRGDVRW